MDLDSFLSKLDGVRAHAGGQFEARCPAHHDRVASLSVRAGDHGGIVLRCHAGCETKAVVEALGLTLGDLAGEPYVVATYDYIDLEGNVRYRVQRWSPKAFRCVPGLPPIAERIPYGLAAVTWARTNGVPVYVVEGEKDVDRLAERHIPATCNVGGAGKWLAHYSDYLAGCDVIVVADDDEPGRKHARDVAASLRFTARSVYTCKPRYGNDISALFDAGWGLDQLDPLPESDGAEMVTVANVIMKAVTWAWEGFIPFGKVTLIEGDPGDGKSLLAIDLVARWSSGAPMPDGQRRPGGGVGVAFLSAEDDPEDTLAPRLRAAGADVERVYVLAPGAMAERPFNVAADEAMLRALVIRHDIKVVIIDPLAAMLSDRVDTHVDASVRQGLFPLFRLARDTGAAVICIRHLNKASGGKAIYRGGGSIGFVGMARAAFSVGRNPDSPDQRVFSCVMSNLAVAPPSLGYSIENGANGPYVKWHGIVELSAQNVVDGQSREELDELLEFLNTVVENGQPMAWKDIVRRGRQEGFSERSLRRRRRSSRLEPIQGEGGRRGVRWGYLEHTLAADEAVTQSDDHDVQIGPYGQVATSLSPEKHGHMATWEPNRTPSDYSLPPPEDRQDQDWDEVERRDAELDALPRACSICRSDVNIHKFYEPYWVIRCSAHSPLRYHEKGLAE